eukprot:GHRQ01039094.1.p2 GENE.GHRQ01039094.1~~GHRQ01039094.1.p2  ORF type:complete len:159 (-),score=22.70 GHRQ01039094.1:883-1359(-)
MIAAVHSPRSYEPLTTIVHNSQSQQSCTTARAMNTGASNMPAKACGTGMPAHDLHGASIHDLSAHSIQQPLHGLHKRRLIPRQLLQVLHVMRRCLLSRQQHQVVHRRGLARVPAREVQVCRATHEALVASWQHLPVGTCAKAAVYFTQQQDDLHAAAG